MNGAKIALGAVALLSVPSLLSRRRRKGSFSFELQYRARPSIRDAKEGTAGTEADVMIEIGLDNYALDVEFSGYPSSWGAEEISEYVGKYIRNLPYDHEVKQKIREAVNDDWHTSLGSLLEFDDTEVVGVYVQPQED